MDFPNPSKSAGSFVESIKDKLNFGSRNAEKDDYAQEEYDYEDYAYDPNFDDYGEYGYDESYAVDSYGDSYSCLLYTSPTRSSSRSNCNSPQRSQATSTIGCARSSSDARLRNPSSTLLAEACSRIPKVLQLALLSMKWGLRGVCVEAHKSRKNMLILL